MFDTIFLSSKTTALQLQRTATLHINLCPNKKQVKIWTQDAGGKRNKIGPSVVLVGEDFINFMNWMNENASLPTPPSK